MDLTEYVNAAATAMEARDEAEYRQKRIAAKAEAGTRLRAAFAQIVGVEPLDSDLVWITTRPGSGQDLYGTWFVPVDGHGLALASAERHGSSYLYPRILVNGISQTFRGADEIRNVRELNKHLQAHRLYLSSRLPVKYGGKAVDLRYRPGAGTFEALPEDYPTNSADGPWAPITWPEA